MTFHESEEVEKYDLLRFCPIMYDKMETADLEYSRFIFEELMGGQGYDFDTNVEYIVLKKYVGARCAKTSVMNF